MDIDAYLELVAKRLKEAQAQGNKEEVIRLLEIVSDTCQGKANELKETK